MKKLAVLQSNYIPWKGYFDMIASVDEFIIYDDVQFTKNDWRNRNQIKTPNGPQWLTIPVRHGMDQSICEVELADTRWPEKHLRSLQANYGRAGHFDAVMEFLAPLYRTPNLSKLSEVNVLFLKSICRYLQITTTIRDVSEFGIAGERSQRLFDLCKATAADCYVSGPSARAYLDVGLFAEAGIEVEWFDYSNYRSYPQLWGEFTHNVSVVDLLFNCGPGSRGYLRY